MLEREKIDLIEDLILNQLGAEKFLKALLWAMSYDEKNEYFDYICRMYELETE